MSLPEEPDIPAQISVTSMIDVVFAILTFFIVSSLSLTRTEGLPVNLPQAGSGKLQEETKLVVTIDSENRLLLNRQPTNLIEIPERINSLMAKEGQTTVIINADERIGYGQVIQVMDRIRNIPKVKVAIATKRG